ncbi:beta-aspartyl-peptidase (threonine type) [Halopelagius inordinatus]|uniref:Plant-type L-asparaginase n=1 Tax=Halopelagius inordinatus TaxID=553467 RepID=A0A1I2SFV6_9EURY|nr:isoaspartyl peptidase/L-asparaginase [Halopelagius inordinatus]SFG48911.1 beta-aspartyl-peptidase (threonine type) [Halopelagius inordinatus]
MRVIVHGGAGGVPDEPEPRQETLDEAANAGAGAETPVDAVEAAVRVLETDPAFNAGVGGAVQSDGVVRTDAGVMTSDREAGAAAGMAGVEHAVSVARGVMEETPHVLVAGDPAVDFAADFGIETDADLFTTETRERWEDADPPEGSTRDHLAWLDARFGETTADPTDEADLSDHDTVGAVAFDGDDFAAATSTGGRWFALAGRVGDVPQIGSGFYASAAGGASATGAGEDIAKTTLSRRAVRHLERGLDAQTAAETAIAEFGELTGSEAGVIVLDDEGVGRAFNSEGMQTSVTRT